MHENPPLDAVPGTWGLGCRDGGHVALLRFARTGVFCPGPPASDMLTSHHAYGCFPATLWESRADHGALAEDGQAGRREHRLLPQPARMLHGLGRLPPLAGACAGWQAWLAGASAMHACKWRGGALALLPHQRCRLQGSACKPPNRLSLSCGSRSSAGAAQPGGQEGGEFLGQTLCMVCKAAAAAHACRLQSRDVLTLAGHRLTVSHLAATPTLPAGFLQLR